MLLKMTVVISHHSTLKGKKGEEEFFVLCTGEVPIGRAAIALGSKQADKKFVGFIDDFVIDPEYKDFADTLIKRCLAILKKKGAEEVIVRSRSFPALQTQGYENIPSYGLPHNPPWYLDILRANGFVPEKEWAVFRFKPPSKILEESIGEGERPLESQNAKFKSLNLSKRDQVKDFVDLIDSTSGERSCYLLTRFTEGSDSVFKAIFNQIIYRLIEFRIYIGQNKFGGIVSFFYFRPDFNFAYIPLSSGADSRSLPAF